MMLPLRVALLLFALAADGVWGKEICEDTRLVVSKCYGDKSYQWLMQVPNSKKACEGQSVPPPISVECDFACPKGEALDMDKLKCKPCSEGTFSLGGGHQLTFSELDKFSTSIPELSFKSTSIIGSYDSECKKNNAWRVKGNVLQGEVQQNCVLSLSLRFKLERAGTVRISYNLPTSLVFGTITSRCDFDIEQKDDDDDDDDTSIDPKRKAEFTLVATGYGSWKEKQISIKEPGDYILTLFTVGVNAFHFPFSIRSIIIEGSAFLQECIPCPPGTFADEKHASSCTPCRKDTYTDSAGSTECSPCQSGQYADEGASKCTPRPKCEAKHYQKVFTGCDKSNMATITYQPIQPQICTGPAPRMETIQSPCGTCNPGMFKKNANDRCEFCPPNTYSNGTLSSCLPCASDLSLTPGLYYKVWNEMPEFLNRSYMSFDKANDADESTHHQSWIPSIDYISSQPVPDTVSLLSLSIAKGFRTTDLAKATKEYGSLYFKFSMQCQSSCKLFLIAESIYDDDDDDWQIINKWHINDNSDHKNVTEYNYTVLEPEEVVFSWLFSSDDQQQGTDELRIYEIRVTNTQLGGSDRCVTCLTANDQETECKQCAPGSVLTNNTCVACPNGTIATRMRSQDPVPTKCQACPANTISDDGMTCYVPCKQTFGRDIPYDLNSMSTIEFHGSKLFTQKGSGYFHVFNASICGKTKVTCTKVSVSEKSSARTSKKVIESKLCRIGSVPDENGKVTSAAYIDEFGETLVNVTLSTSTYFPALRSDYNLTDITLVYRANTSTSLSACSQRTTSLSLRCDHGLDEQQKKNTSVKYRLQTPSDCPSGTCDGCTFYFLLRTPLACPACDENQGGFRVFLGPCRFGRQEVRKIPHPYCAHSLSEKVETRRCSVLSTELQIVFGFFLIIAVVLVALVVMCWRKNRKLEYRYMQLVENTNPDDDTPVDNVCAQISDEEESGDEVHFKKPSKAKKIINRVRNAIRKNPNNEQSDFFNGDSFLLTNQSKDDA